MPISDLVEEASLFVAVALVLALATIWLRRDLRKSTVRMVAFMLAGLIGLVLVERFGPAPGEGPFGGILREGTLAVLAIGVARITVNLRVPRRARQGGRPADPRRSADGLRADRVRVLAHDRRRRQPRRASSRRRRSSPGVLAFSLQETLGNLWGGIQLQLDNTCRIGDWIQIDTVHGAGDRHPLALHGGGDEQRRDGDHPNGSFSKGRVMVLVAAAATGGFRGDARCHFGVSYDTPPARVIAAVEASLKRAEIPNIAATPALDVLCRHFGEKRRTSSSSATGSPTSSPDTWTDSQVRLHVAATLSRHHMQIPYPHRVLGANAIAGACPGAGCRRARQRRLPGLDLFVPLNDAEREAVARKLEDFPFVADDVITRQGEPADSLFILARGRVAIVDDKAKTAGTRNRLATLAAPAYFGEMGLLTGQARRATVIAEDEVLCYRLEKAAFDAILQGRPELVDALSQVVAARQAANDAKLQSLSEEVRTKQTVGRRTDLVRRMKSFFALE
jgi:CRP-like cAMP-binding protein